VSRNECDPPLRHTFPIHPPICNYKMISSLPILYKKCAFIPIANLASGDVKTNGARVVILEEAQASSRGRAKLVRDSPSSWASEGRHNGGRARSDGLDTEVSLDGTLRGIRGGLGSDVVELNEVNLPIAREIVGGSLKLGLLWKEEYQGASAQYRRMGCRS